MSRIAASAERDVVAPPGVEEFRRACAQFPTGVAVVTVTSLGEHHGSTVNAFTSLTLDPPQVLVCLAASSRTLAAVGEAGAFAVNLLADDQADLAQHFATKDADKFLSVGHRPGVVGAPLLEGTLGAFECELAEAVRNHSHWILVGRVVRVTTDVARDPLVFLRGRFGA